MAHFGTAPPFPAMRISVGVLVQGLSIPAIRGETAQWMEQLRNNQSQSPRGRGGLEHFRSFVGVDGSIPACAGEPRSGTRWAAQTGVYPRMRGGAIVRRNVIRGMRGLFPACAGEPPAKARGSDRLRGLSPHARGSPKKGPLDRSGVRVYPRMRGGATIRASIDIHQGGLSPHARGSHRVCVAGRLQRGSIPACAGEPRD